MKKSNVQVVRDMSISMYLFYVSMHTSDFVFMCNCVCALLIYTSIFVHVCMFMCAACLHTYDHLCACV